MAVGGADRFSARSIGPRRSRKWTSALSGYFVTAASLSNISKAANQLRIAQPALSRQIRKLEKELGVRLLRCNSTGVQLTAAGALLMDKGESILRQLEQVTAEVRASGHEPGGPVSVALMPSVVSLIAPALVMRMRERYPKVTLRISEGLTTSIVGELLAKRIDLGLIPTQSIDTALSSTPLLTEPMFLIGPGKLDYGEADKPKTAVTIRRLAGLPTAVAKSRPCVA